MKDIKIHRAIFLDRDGTINEDVGDLFSIEKLRFIPHAIEALKILQEEFLLFIVTNQSGIGKNIFSQEEFVRFNKHFNYLLNKEGVIIKKTYYCPHIKEEDCACRKPKPYFLKEADQEYNIDLTNSYVLGDHPHDIEMAQAVGANAIYLLTGHGKKHKKELSAKPDLVANDLYEAAVWIMKNREEKD
ncbi:MAG: HAD family hydrolase [Candidatus Margulisiibacteriota bacterium]